MRIIKSLQNEQIKNFARLKEKNIVMKQDCF